MGGVRPSFCRGRALRQLRLLTPRVRRKLFRYSLGLGATSALAPGNAAMWEMGMKWVEGQSEVAAFDDADIPAMEARYKGLTPIFHKFDAYGNKVSHAGINQ